MLGLKYIGNREEGISLVLYRSYKTVSVTPADTGEQDVDHAIVGDFAGMFKWGYGKEISLDVIEYGDPDNTGVDLKGHNQVYLRAEAFLGWAIFDPESFAKVNGKVTNS